MMTKDEKIFVSQIIREKNLGAIDPSLEASLMDALWRTHKTLFQRAAQGDSIAMNTIRVEEGLSEYRGTGE
jgi:hypothetical protein